MATINATIGVTSDITNNAGISSDMTMRKAGSTTGIELTTGLAKRAFSSNNQVVLQIFSL